MFDWRNRVIKLNLLHYLSPLVKIGCICPLGFIAWFRSKSTYLCQCFQGRKSDDVWFVVKEIHVWKFRIVFSHWYVFLFELSSFKLHSCRCIVLNVFNYSSQSGVIGVHVSVSPVSGHSCTYLFIFYCPLFHGFPLLFYRCIFGITPLLNTAIVMCQL